MEHRQFVGRRPIQALLGPGRKPQRGSESELWSSGPFRAARLSDVKPLLLPLLDRIIESTYWPCNVGHLAYHGASALSVLAAHYLGLHIKKI